MNIYNGILALYVSSCFANASVTLVDFEEDPNIPSSNWSGVGFLEKYQGLRFECLENGIPTTPRYTNGSWNSTGWGYYNANSTISQEGSYSIGVIGQRAAFTPYYTEFYRPEPVSWSIRLGSGNTWHFFGAWFTSVWETGNIRIQGIRNGNTVFDYGQSISNEYRSWVSYGAGYEIDTLYIWNEIDDSLDSRKHFIMDNFYYMEAVPAPGAFALGMFTLALGTSRRRK